MTTANHDNPPLWQFIPLTQYELPPEPAAERVQRGLRGLWSRVMGQGKAADESPDQNDFRMIPEAALDLIAGLPRWHEGVPALDDCLQDWLQSEQNGSCLKVVVAPPYSGVRQMVEAWAAMKNWQSIEPPASATVLSPASDALHELRAHASEPLLVSRLEKWYLRHHNGLDLVRELIAQLAGRRRYTLICCDSWAWAYLKRTVHVHDFWPVPLTLAAFDQGRLRRWLRSLVELGNGLQREFHCAVTGESVLERTGSSGKKDENDTGDFLGRATAYSRGIPGVAHALWRRGLRFGRRTEEVEQGADGNQDAELAHDACRPQQIGVMLWRKLDLPQVPAADRTRTAFFLHALLLHDGMPMPLLSQLHSCLLNSPAESLQELCAAGVVALEQGLWRLTALGYPAARQFLRQEEYLVDEV